METVSVVKDRLHERINEINDVELLKSIEKILIAGGDDSKQKKESDLLLNVPHTEYFNSEENIPNVDDTRVRKTSEEIVQMLNEREAGYLSGKDKVYTLEEFKAQFEKEHGL